MTRREAKRVVCRVVAEQLDNEVDHAAWVDEYAETDADVDRLVEAAPALVDELWRRGS